MGNKDAAIRLARHIAEVVAGFAAEGEGCLSEFMPTPMQPFYPGANGCLV